LAFVVAPAATVTAADPPIVVTVNPSSVPLTPGATASGVVVITNNGISPAAKVHIDPLVVDSSVMVTMPVTDVTVPCGGSYHLAFTLTRHGEGSGQDVSIFFESSYAMPVPGSAATLPEVVITAMTVKAVASPTIIEAKIVSSAETINENRPGDAVLVITNPRETNLHVESMDVSAPASVDVDVGCPNGKQHANAGTTTPLPCPMTIGPRSDQIVHLLLNPTSSVQPGPRTLVISVQATNPDIGQSAGAVANQAFTVEVFAESDILKTLGIPIFLLLPGVVVVVTAWFLITKLIPWKPPIPEGSLVDTLTKATPTALLSLAVSLAIAFAYPTLTTHFWPHAERNYLKAYGFNDFYYVFVYSFAIALGAWGFAWLIYFRRWLFVVSPGDPPASVLRKVGLRGLFPRGKAQFPQVKVDDQPKGLNLGKRKDDKILLTPIIEVSMVGQEPDIRNRIAGYRTSTAGFSAFLLWRTIRDAIRRDKVRISYKVNGVHQPEMQNAATAINAPPRPLVEIAATE
jgi:hypothetical protein